MKAEVLMRDFCPFLIYQQIVYHYFRPKPYHSAKNLRYICDGTDTALFKSDLGRSEFSNPCPACTEKIGAVIHRHSITIVFKVVFRLIKPLSKNVEGLFICR